MVKSFRGAGGLPIGSSSGRSACRLSSARACCPLLDQSLSASLQIVPDSRADSSTILREFWLHSHAISRDSGHVLGVQTSLDAACDPRTRRRAPKGDCHNPRPTRRRCRRHGVVHCSGRSHSRAAVLSPAPRQPVRPCGEPRSRHDDGGGGEQERGSDSGLTPPAAAPTPDYQYSAPPVGIGRLVGRRCFAGPPTLLVRRAANRASPATPGSRQASAR